MHRVAHYVSGGLIVALPGPEEDHNPETKASIAAVMGGRPDVPAEQRAEVVRLIEDLTVPHEAGWYSVISLHGGGSPEAMKREIWRNYPVMEKVELVEGLLDQGILDEGRRVSKQPGRCYATGCQVPEPPQRVEMPSLQGAGAMPVQPRLAGAVRPRCRSRSRPSSEAADRSSLRKWPAFCLRQKPWNDKPEGVAKAERRGRVSDAEVLDHRSSQDGKTQAIRRVALKIKLAAVDRTLDVKSSDG
jgi:4-hydroxyphenylacetate 3-hydroxylase C terminal